MKRAKLKIGDNPRHTHSTVREIVSICERIYYVLEYETGLRIVSEELLFIHINFNDQHDNTIYENPIEAGEALSKKVRDTEKCENYEYEFFGTENYS